MHIDERFGNNGDHLTSKTSLYTLAFIGLLVLLMACINFVNLSTALAATRSKEVGIRKVMGGSKMQMRAQVLVETTTIVFIATAIALGLAWLALPYVKNIMIVQSKLHLFNPGSILFIVLAVAATVILSGAYPAIVMGSGKHRRRGGNSAVSFIACELIRHSVYILASRNEFIKCFFIPYK